MFRYDHKMKSARWDGRLTTGTQIVLTSGVWLDRRDDQREKIAHAKTASVATNAKTTMTTSVFDFVCGRNGLKPMSEW